MKHFSFQYKNNYKYYYSIVNLFMILLQTWHVTNFDINQEKYLSDKDTYAAVAIYYFMRSGYFKYL